MGMGRLHVGLCRLCGGCQQRACTDQQGCMMWTDPRDIPDETDPTEVPAVAKPIRQCSGDVQVSEELGMIAIPQCPIPALFRYRRWDAPTHASIVGNAEHFREVATYLESQWKYACSTHVQWLQPADYVIEGL